MSPKSSIPGTRLNVRYPPWARSLSGGEERVYRTFTDRKVGEAWVAQEKAKIKAIRAGAERQSVGIHSVQDLTFTAASGLWLKAFEGSAGTRKWYQMLLRAHLLPVIGELRCSQIGRDAVLRYQGSRKMEKASLDAQAKELTVLRAVLRWARDGGHPVDSTAWKVKKPKVIPVVSRKYDPEVMGKLLVACRDDRERTILEVALMTGMRRGELKAFQTSWILWYQGVIHIPADQGFAPKSRKPRSIPLYQSLRELLLRWLGERREGQVFPPLRKGKSGKGEAGGADVRAIIQRAKKAAKVTIQGAHDLRHHYGSWLLSQGFNIVEVQEILGHSEVNTTRRYLHMAPDYMAHARDRLDRAAFSWVEPEKSGAKVVQLTRIRGRSGARRKASKSATGAG